MSAMSEAVLSISFRNRALLYSVLCSILEQAEQLDLGKNEERFVQQLVDGFDDVFDQSYDVRAELYVERDIPVDSKTQRRYAVKPPAKRKSLSKRRP